MIPLARLLSAVRPRARLPQTIAAVDLGSNSFHLIVARVINGQPHVLDRLQEMVRLAAGLDERHRLDKATTQRALEALERFGERLRGLPPEAVRAVGTHTLRRARNGARFLAAAQKALGHSIEIISGQEEARLIYQGVAQNLPDTKQQRLVIDVGGGSTELILGVGLRPELVESLSVGCISLSRSHFPNGKVNATAMRDAVTAARLGFKPVEAQFRARGWEQAYGSSGSIRAIAAVVQGQKWVEPNEGITAVALERLRDTLIARGDVRALEFPGLSPERAPVFAGGVAALLAAFQALGLKNLQIADSALREGLLYDLYGRLHQDDVRSHTVQALSERYHVDAAQAQRVARTVRECFEQVAGDWKLDDESARALSWAAQLHELGLAVSHSKYHQHGAYLLAHSDMPGFAHEEQQLLGVLVRAHRRRFPIEVFEELPRRRAKRTRRMAVLLRLAVLLNRGRTDTALPKLRMRAEKYQLAIEFPNGWLARNRLTDADLAHEAKCLRDAGVRLSYE